MTSKIHKSNYNNSNRHIARISVVKIAQGNKIDINATTIPNQCLWCFIFVFGRSCSVTLFVIRCLFLFHSFRTFLSTAQFRLFYCSKTKQNKLSNYIAPIRCIYMNSIHTRTYSNATVNTCILVLLLLLALLSFQFTYYSFLFSLF